MRSPSVSDSESSVVWKKMSLESVWVKQSGSTKLVDRPVEDEDVDSRPSLQIAQLTCCRLF